MAGKIPYYKKIVDKTIEKAKKFEASLPNNHTYYVLKQWLDGRHIRLENEMFKALLNASKNLGNAYLSSGTENIKEACEDTWVYHTYTGRDGIHTDPKEVEKYLMEFWPALKASLEETLSYGNYEIRAKKVDVVQVGTLFDEIIQIVGEENKDQIIALMDDFTRNNLNNQ